MCIVSAHAVLENHVGSKLARLDTSRSGWNVSELGYDDKTHASAILCTLIQESTKAFVSADQLDGGYDLKAELARAAWLVSSHFMKDVVFRSETHCP